MNDTKLYDTIIIGGSYAGLSAAMSLGRSLRDVVVVDSGTPCNRQTPRTHNFITHDGDQPAVISAKAKEQVLRYRTVKFFNGKAVQAQKIASFFAITTECGKILHAKKLLFATGIVDIMPDIPGYAECWGISLLHCPYCHGYEIGEQKTGIIGNGDSGYDYAKVVFHWTKNLVIFTNGEAHFNVEQLAKLQEKNIAVITKIITRLEHQNGYVQRVIFNDYSSYELEALYAHPPFEQQCTLPAELGCKINSHGLFAADIFQKTCVPGVYVAGDNSTLGRAVPVSVAAGSVAGIFINKEIIAEEF